MAELEPWYLNSYDPRVEWVRVLVASYGISPEEKIDTLSRNQRALIWELLVRAIPEFPSGERRVFGNSLNPLLEQVEIGESAESELDRVLALALEIERHRDWPHSGAHCERVSSNEATDLDEEWRTRVLLGGDEANVMRVVRAHLDGMMRVAESQIDVDKSKTTQMYELCALQVMPVWCMAYRYIRVRDTGSLQDLLLGFFQKSMPELIGSQFRHREYQIHDARELSYWFPRQQPLGTRDPMIAERLQKWAWPLEFE